MNIYGIGTDIVNVNRIRNAIKKNNKTFKKRIFTKFEIQACEKRKNNISCFAKRFAAKEALVKALGTGFRYNINFNDICVKNNSKGKPKIILSKKLRKILKEKHKINKYRIYLSLSDEKKHSLAFVIIDKIK